jgi:hypothetical protein
MRLRKKQIKLAKKNPHNVITSHYEKGKLVKTTDTKKEAVNHPSHYGGKDNPYEAIKIIEYSGANFLVGNTLKYLLRAGKKYTVDKNSEVHALEDLKKARWYLDREISNIEGK